jgi:hypothetical protein
MKKYLSLVVGATTLIGATMGIAQTANAQAAAAPAPAGASSGPFADVPADHWAYQAVNTLKSDGIVIGYPDGTYGGRRAMTRYEFAVAIARMLPMIQNQIDTSQFVKNSDFQAFQNTVNGQLQQEQAAIDALKALVAEFQPELAQLGQDVKAIDQRLDSDEQRIAVLEQEQRRVVINGELNIIADSLINTDKHKADPLDKNGYRIGTMGSQSLFTDVNVYHDFLLTVDGRVSDTAHAIVKIDAGNYLSHLGDYEGYLPGGGASTAGAFGFGGITSGTRDENTEPGGDTFSLFRAYLDVPVSLGPLSGAEVQVGRFGEQFTPFTLKAINPDVYTSLPETSTGDVTSDGIKATFGIGGAHANIYAAKNAPVDGAEISAGPSAIALNGAHRPGSGDLGGSGIIDTLGAGAAQNPQNIIDQSAGARVTIGNPNDFTLGVTGLLARTTGSSETAALYGTLPGNGTNVDPYNSRVYNNVAVYGADFNGTLPFVKKSGLTADGEFANSATGYNSRFGNVNSSKGTEAYYAELGYTFGPVNIKGGYKEVYNNFAGPGFWGQLGSYTNPTNVKGGIVHASYAISPQISLVGDGNFFSGIYNVANQSPLGKNDDLTQYDVGLKYGLSSAYGLDLGYEWVQWNLKNQQGLLANSGKPTESYITFGIGHSFNQNASLKLLYQIIDYSDKNTGFDPNGDSHGGVALTQFSVKF